MRRSFGRAAFLRRCTARDASYMTGMLSLPACVADLDSPSPWVTEESAVSIQRVFEYPKGQGFFCLEKGGARLLRLYGLGILPTS